MPVLYLSHGAPILADDDRWTGELASWSAKLPRPKSILMVSAHWEESPVTLGATRTVPLTYDFWGFPPHYYDVQYAAPGAPALADDVRKLLSDTGPVEHEAERGLDHGAYVPLKEMYPDADIPVLQMSMPSLDPRQLFDLGRRLAPLRDQEVLVVGSGFTTHNLRLMDFGAGADQAPAAWAAEFDDWVRRALAEGDVDSVLDFQHKAPAARIAHPRIEHFAPLFVSLGASLDQSAPETTVDGFWYGMAKRSVQFG